MDDTSNLIGHCNSPHCNMKIEDAAIDDHNGVSLPVSKYFKTLVKELHNEPENCQKFVLLLKDFRNKSIDHVGVLLNLEELLKHKLHLFHGFKELLNEVDCVEREQTKAELAFLYVCKVKDHFHNDQRFQIFTEIFTKFTLNEKTKLEVYHEMQELFGSHKELFEEFRKFYGAVPEAMPLLSEPSGATLKNQDGREDCSKEDQECKESNIGDKKANLVEPKSSSKRKRMQTGDIITANHQQEGGSVEPDVRMGYVNNEMDRVDKAKSCRDSGAGRGKAPVAVDEIVPEANKALSADDKIVPEPPVYEGDDSAQNDDSVAANGSCGKSVRLVDQYEQALFKVEDDRFESDMLRNLVASTAMRVEDLLKKISNKTVEQTPLCLEDHFTQQSLQCIEEMYREYSPEVKEALRNDPATALPVLLARLEKKKQGVSILKSDLDKIWRAASERNYKLSRQLQRSIPSIRT